MSGADAVTTTEARATPAAVHLASLAPGSRASTAAALRRAAKLAAGNDHADGLAFPWHRRPPDTLAAVRGRLAESYAVSTANASLAGIRGALRAAWLAGDLSRDGYERRSAALKRVGGRAAPGRVLNAAQVGKLFQVAADDRNAAAGARDAALLAVLYGLGLRRTEARLPRARRSRPGRRNPPGPGQGPPGAPRPPGDERGRRRRRMAPAGRELHPQGRCAFPRHTVPTPLPRRKPASALVALFPASRRPSPQIRRVGFRNRVFSRPARRSLTFRPARSLNRPRRPFPRRTVSHPLDKRAFPRRTDRSGLRRRPRLSARSSEIPVSCSSAAATRRAT